MAEVAEAEETKGWAIPEWLFWLAWIGLWAWFALFFEYTAFRGRVPISDIYVSQVMNDRLHPWLEYAEEIDYWFTEFPRSKHSFASCSYSRGLGPRTPDIFVYTGKLELWEWKSRTYYCLKHEIGHHIDYRRGRISQTERFRRLVARSIVMWVPTPPNAGHQWYWTGKRIAEYPGINGNPLDENGWGGWEELYATLHEVNYLVEIPPPLQEYFTEFLYYNRLAFERNQP